MRRVMLITLALMLPAAASSQTANEREAVLNTVQLFFDAMTARDVETTRKVMVPEGRAFGMDMRKPNAAPLTFTHEEYVARLKQTKYISRERIWNPEVRVHGSIATVWAPYDLWVDGQYSHCGIDAFDLVKTAEGWKIAGAVFTMEAKCDPSPLGPLKQTPEAQVETTSPYLNQPLPGFSPVRFAPGIVSTDAIELNGVFAPDFKEFFFARLIEGVQTMFHSEFANGLWSAPRPLLLFPDHRPAVADDMTVSPDGRELYFLGNHPSGVGRSDIWRSKRVNGKWATAEVLPAPVNTEASEVYPVIVGDGSLYFTSNRPGGLGPRSSLYRAQRLQDGSFAAPVLVPPPINNDFGIGDTYVSPDESYMVFSSGRPPSPGGGDLFVSFRHRDGAWSEPAHLGPVINTEQVDFCPMVTPDGRFLFFSRRHGATWSEATAGDVYWVDAKILSQFRR